MREMNLSTWLVAELHVTALPTDYNRAYGLVYSGFAGGLQGYSQANLQADLQADSQADSQAYSKQIHRQFPGRFPGRFADKFIAHLPIGIFIGRFQKYSQADYKQICTDILSRHIGRSMADL